MTIRIKLGTATINEIMRTSCQHHKALWFTILVPLAQFLSDVPDWSVLDQADLDKALQGLPGPMLGPVPPGISIQESGRNKVKSPYPLLYIRCRMRCRIRYYMMYIAYDISYDIVCDV
jgi:hypothetical protein